MSAEVCRSDGVAGTIVDEALAILRSDLRPAVELAEQDEARAAALWVIAVQVRDALATWREVDAITGTAVVNRPVPRPGWWET